MTWFGFVFLGVILFSAGASCMSIGQPRQPLTRTAVLMTILINAGLFWGSAAVGVIR